MNPLKILAPMAGITDGKFCSKLASHGFDLVTIGGYNVDRATIAAGESIIHRGRSEFHVTLRDVISHIDRQIGIIKDGNSWKGMLAVNMRALSPKPIIDISKLAGVDVVEINAHCRQPEITELGCGQALLHHPHKLEEFTRNVVDKSECKVSVKIRANVPGVDTVAVVKSVEMAGADFIHVDAMKPGYPHADYDIITSIKQHTDIFLIGNNSIKDVETAQKMITAGSNGISMARVLINGNVPFDLRSIKF
jgi:TIM-barrel protein